MSVTGGHVDSLADKATAGAKNIDENMVVPLHNSGPPQRPRDVSVKECKRGTFDFTFVNHARLPRLR